jgi:ParB family chromosome partitioning protein
MISYRVTLLDLTAVDLKNDTYRVSTSVDINALSRSIQHVGLINSPVFVRKQERYIIVSGFHRIAAMQQLNYRKTPAKILPAESSILDCVRIAVTDNISHRTLNLLEISRALSLLHGCIEDRECLCAEAQNLGLPGNYPYIEKIIGVCGFPPLIQEGIRQNRISLNMAVELQSFDAPARDLLTMFFMELKVNQNKQTEICSHLKEIAHREKCSPREVLSSEAVAEVLADKDLDNLQKTRIVRSKLRRRRFPNLSLAEEAFQLNLRKLNLGSRITLLPPENFEGTSLKLNISFKSRSELKKQIDVLNRALVNPYLQKIIPSN